MYIQIQYGIANDGIIKIPSRLIDKNEDGSFDIFIKKSEFFYFKNPDNSTSNKFMKGSTLINQLAYESGQYILAKNPNISKLDLLIKEYNYLVSHNISDSEQFFELHDRFIEQIKQTQNDLERLDNKIERFNKIASALEDIHTENSIDMKVAYHTLEKFNIDPGLNPKAIEKQIIEISIERKGLKEKFNNIVKDFINYQKLDRNAEARRTKQSLYGKLETKEDLTK